MLTHYLVLGLGPGATGDEVRGRYLELVREHPPGRDPEVFQRISRAYEALKDERARVQAAIFGSPDPVDFETALMDLVRARQPGRGSPGLGDLVAAEGMGDAGGA